MDVTQSSTPPFTYTLSGTATDEFGPSTDVTHTFTGLKAGTYTVTLLSIYLENGICKCPSASAGDTQAINGTTYTAVNNSTIAGEICKW